MEYNNFLFESDFALSDSLRPETGYFLELITTSLSFLVLFICVVVNSVIFYLHFSQASTD